MKNLPGLNLTVKSIPLKSRLANTTDHNYDFVFGTWQPSYEDPLDFSYAGLVSVDPQYIEAAKGCGMSAMQSLTQVELPLAMPTIIGGLRMSTVYTVSWAVLASMIGGGGLGDFIYAGISSNDNMLILMGAIPAALLAFVLGSLVDLLQRCVVPKGMQRGGSDT